MGANSDLLIFSDGLTAGDGENETDGDFANSEDGDSSVELLIAGVGVELRVVGLPKK